MTSGAIWPAIIGIGGASGAGALSILFFALLGLIALVVVMGVLITLFRQLPLWLFDSWPHLVGIGAGIAVYLAGRNWMAALAFAGAGIGFGFFWTALVERQARRGSGFAGRVHNRLLKHASR